MREAVISVQTSAMSDLGVEEFLSLCIDGGLRGITELVCTGPGGIVAVQVERPLDEERLSSFDYIERWERIDQAEMGVLYLVKIDCLDLPDMLPSHHELGVSNGQMIITDQGIDISIAGDQEAIAYIIQEYTDAGVPVELRSITEYRGPSSVMDSLTNRQRQILHTAYNMGYYEVPRRISTTELADKLELDPSTVSEHLQRAEHNLLSTILDGKQR